MMVSAGISTVCSALVLVVLLANRTSALVGSVVPKDRVIEVGSDFTLSCNLSPSSNGGRTAHDVIWLRNSARLPQASYMAVSDSLSQLLLVKVTPDTTGTYCCTFPGEGLIQRLKSSTDVSVGRRPKPLLECVIPSPEAYRCSWKNGTFTNIKTKYQFTIWNHRNDSWIYCPTVMPDSTCLVPFGYLVYPDQRARVVSSNKLGTANVTKAFNIDSDVVANPPSNVELATVEAETSLRVTWNLPGEWPTTRAGSLMYKLRYREVSCSMANQTCWTEMPDFKSSSFVYTLSNLDPYTVYGVQMAARYKESWEDNWSVWSEEVTATTRETLPIETVHGLDPIERDNSADSVYKRDLDLFWTVLPEDGQHGRFLGYKVIVESEDLKEPRREYSTKQGWITITGLQKFCGYLIKVAAYNSVGDSLNWSYVHIADHTTTPNAPDEVTAISSTTNSVLVKWVEPSQPNGYIEHFIVQWGRRNDNRESYTTPNASQRSYIIEGLATFDLYEVSIKVTNRLGESEFKSVRGGVRTLEGVPDAPPTNVVVSSVLNQPESLTLIWQRLPDENVNGRLTGYLVSFCESRLLQCSGKMRYANVTRPDLVSLTLTGLQQATPYMVQIAAYTAVGLGPYSDPVKGMTSTDNTQILLAVFLPFTVLLAVVLIGFRAWLQYTSTEDPSKEESLASDTNNQQQQCDDILPSPRIAVISDTLQDKCNVPEEIFQTSCPEPIVTSVALDPKTQTKLDHTASGDTSVLPSPDCVGLQEKPSITEEGNDRTFSWIACSQAEEAESPA